MKSTIALTTKTHICQNHGGYSTNGQTSPTCIKKPYGCVVKNTENFGLKPGLSLSCV